MNKKIIYLFLLLACSTCLAATIDMGIDMPISNDYLTTTGTPSLGTLLMDASEEKIAAIFPVNGDWTFRKFGFVTGTITTGATIDVRLETVIEQTPGVIPSGTLYCASSSATLTIGSTDDAKYKETSDLLSDCTVTNSTVAIVIKRMGSFAGNITTYSAGRSDNIVALSSNSTAGWSVVTSLLNFSAVSSSSTIIPIVGNVLISTISVLSTNSGSSPNTYGNKFTFPFSHRVTGAIYNFSISNAAKVQLWDSDGATVLESVDISSAVSKTLFRGVVRFANSHTFAANTSYRISITPRTTSNISVVRYFYDSADLKKYSVQFGQYIDLTTAKDPTVEGSWTQNTLGVARVFPLIDQFDTGSGGGGGTVGHPF